VTPGKPRYFLLLAICLNFEALTASGEYVVNEEHHISASREDENSCNVDLSRSVDPVFDKEYRSWAKGGVDFEKLKTMAEDPKVKNLDGFLSELFKQDPELTNNATFIHTSRSAQREEISPELPAVTFFSSHFIARMTGDKNGKKHYNKLEVVSLKGGTLGYHLFDFSKSAEKRVSLNEKSCTGCHGRVPRPIWASYPMWPGFYGAHDDLINGKSPTEEKNWKTFVENHGDEERYAHFPLSKFYAKNDNPIFDKKGEIDYSRRKNLQFSKFMGSVRAAFFAKELTRWKDWPRYNLAVLGILSGCDLNQLVPPTVFEAHEKRLKMSYAALTKDTNGKVKAHSERKFDELVKSSGSDRSLRQFDYGRDDTKTSQTTALRFLIEGSENPDDLNRLSFDVFPGGKKTYNLTGIGLTFGSPTDPRLADPLLCELLRSKALRDLKLIPANGAGLRKIQSDANEQAKFCTALAKESRAQLK
jgi:hypothetical protein